MTVALLYGGASTEHDVSCVSARGVLTELATLADTAVELIGITRDGRWYRQPERVERDFPAGRGLAVVEATEQNIVVMPGDGLALRGGPPLLVDVAIPLVHGTTGEDGILQGLLEAAGIAYVGSGVAGSAIGMDKTRSKRLWEQAGLPVVPYLYVERAELTASHITSSHLASSRATAPGSASISASALTRLGERVGAELGYPVFVKPNAGGSSVGISRVARAEGLPAAVEAALAVDRGCLIERALEVREIETAVLGNEELVAFPPGEVVPSHEFYDYEAKYVDPDGARLVLPAPIDAATADRIREMCMSAFRAVDAAGLARVDCFLEKGTARVYLNEINTLPGFTPISMYPKMAAAGGLPYAELLTRLLELGRSRSLR